MLTINSFPIVCKTPAEAVQSIASNSRIYIQEGANSPADLLQALYDRSNEISNVTFTGIMLSHVGKLHDSDSFIANLYFFGPESRKCKPNPRLNFIPMYLGDIGRDLRAHPVDYALLSLSPPDPKGFCSFGTACTIARPAVDGAKKIIAEINKNVPRTHGHSFIHYSQIDYVFETSRELLQFPPTFPTEVHEKIGKFIAEIIPDGACLQIGIGGVPEVVLKHLRRHKNLGVHTEIFSDALIDLLETGAITNSLKSVFCGKVSSASALGTNKLNKAVNDNPIFHFDSAEVINNPAFIALNPKTFAINGAIEVDLTGQVCADTIGTRQFSGVGGQMDFTRGANMSDGGRAFITLPSTTNHGTSSRIVSTLTPGSSVSTPRWEGVTIVTEFGVADLDGLNVSQRAKALISIAHPKFREQLQKEAVSMNL